MKYFFIVIGALIILSIFAVTCNFFGRASNQAIKSTHIDDATQVYEEFQEIYNTCTKINTDLCNMRIAPENDKMFEQFSKNQRILTLQTNLNRWVQEYDAKSKMWGRSLWKSNRLPYELSVDDFNCYNPKN